MDPGYQLSGIRRGAYQLLPRELMENFVRLHGRGLGLKKVTLALHVVRATETKCANWVEPQNIRGRFWGGAWPD